MVSEPPLAGTYTALVTPFSEDGTTIDFEAFDALSKADRRGCRGLVHANHPAKRRHVRREQRLVIERTVRIAPRTRTVMAGAGTFSTQRPSRPLRRPSTRARTP